MSSDDKFFIFGFIAGACNAFLAVVLYGLVRLKKMEKQRKKLLDNVEEKAKEVEAKLAPIKERVAKVKELTDRQLQLAAAMEEPSKNALHSRYKNGLHAEIKDIEEEKNEILLSILRDGFDPSFQVITKDGKETVKLSDYLMRVGLIGQDNDAQTSSTDSTNGPKKVGKFIVYNGGGEGTTH